MQKFEESDEPLSERRNIIVMADEAHRGQYGFSEKVDDKLCVFEAFNGRKYCDSPKAIYLELLNDKKYGLKEIFYGMRAKNH